MTTEANTFQQQHWVIRLLKFEGQIILVLLLLLLAFLAYGTLPNRWYHVLYAYSGSMQPTFAPGDLIVITETPEILKPGSVVTLSVDGQFVTHRLIHVEDDGTFITQGDNNPVPDQWGNAKVDVIGIYRFRIRYLGYLANISRLFQADATGSWFNDEEMVPFSISTKSCNHKKEGTSIHAELSALGFFDAEEQSYGVEGEVCIMNNGQFDTQGLLLIAQIEYKNKEIRRYEPIPETVFSIQTEGELESGEIRCYEYRFEFNPLEDAHYRLSVAATISNHSGWLPSGPHCEEDELCPFGPTVRAEFKLPVIDVIQGETPVPTEVIESTPFPSEIPLENTDQPFIPTSTPDPDETNEEPETVITTEVPEATETHEPVITPEISQTEETPEETNEGLDDLDSSEESAGIEPSVNTDSSAGETETPDNPTEEALEGIPID